MGPNLPGRPKEEGIINVEGFGKEWRQRGDGSERERPAGMSSHPSLNFISHAASI
jgi:hypothetical protein